MENQLNMTELTALAAVFTVLTGAAVMPVLAVATRVAVRVLLPETITIIIRLLVGEIIVKLAMIAVVVLAAVIGSASLVRPALAGQAPVAAQTEASVVSEAIEGLWLQLSGPWKKPAPVWILDSAAKIYCAVQTYRNGRKVDKAVRVAHAALANTSAVKAGLEEVSGLALAALKELAVVKAMIEADRELSDRDFRLVRSLLDAQIGRLDAVIARLDTLTDRVSEIERLSAEHAARVKELEVRAAAGEALLHAAREQSRYWQARTAAVERVMVQVRADTAVNTGVIQRKPCGFGRHHSHKAGGCVDVADRR